MIFATVTRFIASRNAVKTIYWRTVEDGDSVRLVKHTKIINIEAPDASRRNRLYWGGNVDGCSCYTTNIRIFY